MEELQNFINSSRHSMEIKRALAIRMLLLKYKVKDVCIILDVSDSFVNKWKFIYEQDGIEGLKLGYTGREPYLSKEEQKEIVNYISRKKSINLNDIITYIEEKYSIIFKSKQSYYSLLHSSNKSYHKSEKENPKKNEEKVLIKREEIKKNSKVGAWK